jgi:hypothetical protein
VQGQKVHPETPSFRKLFPTRHPFILRRGSALGSGKIALAGDPSRIVDRLGIWLSRPEPVSDQSEGRGDGKDNQYDCRHSVREFRKFIHDDRPSFVSRKDQPLVRVGSVSPA